MEREKSVIEFYVLCNKLKDVIRTGWKDWKVKRNRIESVAEHIYGVLMLAVAVWSEFDYDIDLKKTLTMIAVHETEEILIGDLTSFQISKQEKQKMGHEAVKKIFGKLTRAKEVENLIYEFDERKTSEAKFAYQCDKLECDIQCKIYDQEGRVDIFKQEGNSTAEGQDVKSLLNKYNSWSKMWIKYDQDKCDYDKNFLKISEYILKNKI